jgi:hypothetical protein
MNTAYANLLGNYARTIITHIGLANNAGTEIASGSYARQAVTWTTASNGTIAPTTNLVFNLTAGDQVGQWIGYTASTGGTSYGGATLSSVTFGNNGTYTLNAAGTAINHTI